MQDRCFNPACTAWPNYGGRGIMVCDRWFSFAAFVGDMGERPAGQYSIERVDNEGDYEPGNCVWALPIFQKFNTRRTAWVEWRGETVTLPSLCRATRRSLPTVRRLLSEGFSIEDAIDHRPEDRSIPIMDRGIREERLDATPASEFAAAGSIVQASYLIGHNGGHVEPRYWGRVGT